MFAAELSKLEASCFETEAAKEVSPELLAALGLDAFEFGAAVAR